MKLLSCVQRFKFNFKMQQTLSTGAAPQSSSGVPDMTKKYAQYQNVLKGAKKGEVCTRFPPEPSGYLHIGHIKAAILNYHYSRIYDGKMLLRFDDTNPSKEKAEYQDSILADLKTLGVEHAKLSYSSDYFEQAQEYCRDLIKKGLAYLDNTAVELMRDQRGKGIESTCRAQTPEQNLEIFEKFLQGNASDYCVRAKMDMKAKNKCLRDPVMYRAQDTPHHRTGLKYKVYPTYDFICPILDSIEGVSHAMRTNEYSDRIDQYKWVQKALDLRPVEIYEFARLNLVNTTLSKRKLQALVNLKIVDGWDDPRFPTVRGILRRGIKVETLIEFMLEQGPSKNANLMEWDKLWATNVKIIDPVCPRYSAIGKVNMATVEVANWKGGELDVQSVAQHQKNPELGERPLFRSKRLCLEKEDAASFVVGEKVTFMRWGNVRVQSIATQEDGSLHLTVEDLPEDQDWKGTKKVNWISLDSPTVNVELVEFDHLIVVKKVEEDMLLDNIVNHNSKFVTQAIAESGVRSLNIGDTLQFERRGYYIIDDIRKDADTVTYVAIFIPDGKTKGLASIPTKVDQGTMNKGKQEVESKSKSKKQEKKKKDDAEPQQQQQQQSQQDQPQAQETQEDDKKPE